MRFKINEGKNKTKQKINEQIEKYQKKKRKKEWLKILADWNVRVRNVKNVVAVIKLRFSCIQYPF